MRNLGEKDERAQRHCKECQMGKLNRQMVTYLTWLGDEMITVRDFPAWVCDVCGLRIYDSQALNRLSLLLSPNAGKSTLPTPHVMGGKSKNAQPTPPN